MAAGENITNGSFNVLGSFRISLAALRATLGSQDFIRSTAGKVSSASEIEKQRTAATSNSGVIRIRDMAMRPNVRAERRAGWRTQSTALNAHLPRFHASARTRGVRPTWA